MLLEEPKRGGLNLLSAVYQRDWHWKEVLDALDRHDAKVNEACAAIEKHRPLIGRPAPHDPTIRIVAAAPVVAAAFQELLPPHKRTFSRDVAVRGAWAEIDALVAEVDRLWKPIEDYMLRRFVRAEEALGLIAFSGPFGVRGGRVMTARGFWHLPDIKLRWSESIVETASERLVNVLVYRTEDIEAWSAAPEVERSTGYATAVHPVLQVEREDRGSKSGAPMKGYTKILAVLIREGAVRRDTAPATLRRLVYDRAEARRLEDPDAEPVEIPDAKAVKASCDRLFKKLDEEREVSRAS